MKFSIRQLHQKYHYQCTQSSLQLFGAPQVCFFIMLQIKQIFVFSPSLTYLLCTGVSASPKKHFRYFGDFDEDDVATPRRAKLALRMGKAALHKCRRKIATLEAEKSRLKTRILRLTDKILDLEKKDLLTQNTAQFV